MGFKTFKNGLDADVEALRENTERELFLGLGGEGMVDGERVGFTQGRWLSRLLRLPATGREGGTSGCHVGLVTRCDS